MKHVSQFSEVEVHTNIASRHKLQCLSISFSSLAFLPMIIFHHFLAASLFADFTKWVLGYGLI
ncbi:hypothetical protein C8Q75DRAFT_541059 [Abortiporus biennis]|nr:hypothetical protein C8Q75DRAFT_541059 [Abortiporus biennis]